MKLHLPKSLRTALLSCLAAISPWSLTLASGAISVGAVAFVLASSEAQAATTTYSSSTETYNGETYAGRVFTLDLSYTGWNGDGGDGSYTTWGACNVRFAAQAGTKLMYYTYSTNEAGEEVKTENYVSTNATGPDGKTTWYSFLGANGSYDTEAGNTLRLTGATQNTVIGFDYEPISLGGLIVDACLGGHTYKLMGASGSGGESARDMELKAGGDNAANMTIGANTFIELGGDSFTVASSGEWNVADDINLIIKAGTAQLQAGVQVTLNGLGNLDLGTSALKMADGASIVVAEGAALTLGVNASGSTGTITNNGSVYLENRGSTFALTNNATGTVYLTGANSVATLNNAGTLSFAEGSSLTLGSMANDFYGGKTYDVGNLALTSGGAVSNWAPYFGYNDGTEMTYQDGHLTVTVDGSGYYWNGTADSYSWSAANLLKGGNAATIAAGGRLYLTDSAAYKTVNMDSTVALGDIYLQSDGYTLNVTADNTIPTNFVVGASSYTLTKTGAATLTMSSAQIGKLAGITVNEGDLLVSDRIAVGKPITVNEGGTVVFGGNAASSVNTTVNGNGRVEVDFTTDTTKGHGRNVQLGSGFSGTLALTGLFKFNECQIGSSASYEFSSGEAWTNDNHTVANNINVVGATADDFRFRTDTDRTLTLTGVVTGNYSVGHSSTKNRGTIILANINSGAGIVDLVYSTLQLGNDASTGTISGVAFDDMVVNAASGTTLVIKIKASDSDTAEGAYQLGSTLNISGTVDMTISDGSYHFAEKISLSEGAKLSINNGWDKNQFFSAIDAANATIVMAAANQDNWNTAQRLFLLNSDGDFNLQGSKIELKSAARGEYVHGLAVQKAGALSGAEVSFSSDASDKGSVLLFTNADYRESTAVTNATRVDGAVAGLSGTKGKVYAAGLTINTAAEKSYTYGGELHITSLTKSGAGSQTLTQGPNMSGDMTVNAGELYITQTGTITVAQDKVFTVSVAEGATLDDNRRLSITGGSLTVTGGGIYELEGICLSGQDTKVTTLNVEADTVLHITGTTQSNEGNVGSFMLSNWNANNVINIEGLLVSEAAMSNRDGEGTINIENGGALQLNAGMSRVVHGEHQTTINVKTGGALIVNSDANQTTGIGFVTTTLADGSTVFTTSGATIHNTLAYNGTVQLGAAAGTVLSLTATVPNVGAITILGTGDVVSALSDGAVADIAAGGTVKYTNAVTATAITLNTGAQFEATAGLTLTGALTLGANAEATLGGAVSIASLAGKNAGVLTFAELSSLELKDFVVGTDYHIGSVTDGADIDWGTLLGYGGRQYSVEYDATSGVLHSVCNAIVWSSAADDDITWGGSDNWVMGGESVAVEATDSVLLGTIGDSGVSSTIQLAANTTVAGVTVQDAYSLSVAEGETYSFDTGSIVLAEGGSLRKVGAGTLSMSSEDAVAAQMNIAEGTLSLSDTLTDSESGSRVNLTALSGAGTLSITAAGASGVTGNGTGQRTSIDLADSFTGTLAVVGGNLDMASTIGGAGSVLLDGATLVGTGSVVQNLGWNIAVSDKGAYLRRFGYEGQDNRTEYATRLTGTLTGSSAAMLRVIDSGEWFLAGDMSGYQGGLSIEGNTNYVTFESSATLASLSAVGGSRIFVDNGATLNTATTAVSGAVTTGATEGATLNMGAVTVNANGTLKIEGAGAHTLSTLAMGNNSTLELGANTSASITTATAGTTTGDSGHPGVRAGVRELNGIDFTIKVGSGAELTDAGAWELSGGSDMTVSGGGVYHVAGIALGVNAATSNSLTIDNATTLHITGTNTTGSKFGDSFSLGNWDPNNTITVNGVLALECGISTYKKASSEGSSYKGYAEINVGANGKIAFNNGLHAVASGRGAYTNADSVPDAVKDGFRHVAINIAEGGVLEVSGTNVTGTNSVVVNVANRGVVLGGNANGATESKIANNLNFADGVYIGAKAGTTLTLAPEDGSMDLIWLDVIGTDAIGSNYGAGGKVVFATDVNAQSMKVLAGAEAEFNGSVGGFGGIVSRFENSGKVSFNGNVDWMHQIRNLEGGEMVFSGEMNGSHDALQNAGKLVFDGATVRLENAILNGGEVEILNAADTQFVLSNELMQEIVGVSKTWTLVNNTGMEGLTGTVTGWDALGLENFLLDGSALQLGDWDDVRITDGKVMLYMLTRYWDATGEDGVWNTGADANWREFADSTETVTFETNSRVTFTDTDETGTTALDKSVTVADGGVHAKSVTITGTDYVFSGGKVLVNQSLSAQQNARFDSAVVIGSAAPLQLDVAAGATLTLSTLETVSTQSYGGVSYGSGAFSKTGEGTLLITDAINGTITGATVSGGKLVLGVAGAEDVAKTVSLAVGSNTLTTAGGSLGNVELLSSGTVTDYTGATVQANNVIKSADGVNYAMLTDVELRAGAATGYASLQKVAFAGNSTLSGYITYESTKQQRQMAVATNGTLTVSNLTFDLHGLSAGTKVLIENGAVEGAAEGFKGELLGWDSNNVTLLYSGIAVNSAAVDMGTAGVVALNTAENNNKANMYWDGLVAGAAEDDDPVASSAWDKSSANWSDESGTDGGAAFLALSNAYFGATPKGGSKDVNAAQDIVMSNMFVTEGGYRFTGSRLATLGNMNITPASGVVSFTNELVAQGNVELRAAQGGIVTLGGALQAGGTITASGEGDLSFNSTVQSGGDITLTGNGVVTLAGNVSTAGKFSIGTEGAAVMDKADASTLYTIAGTLTAKDILINMDASTLTAAADTGDHLVVSGNVSAMGDSATPAADGTITLLGSAAKKFTGFVTADTLRVNAAHGTLNNVITFTNVVDVNTLEIAEDTYVRIVHADSDMDTVLLGGTLYMDTVCVTYDNGYDIYSTSDAAELVFGTISNNAINLISGLTPAEAADDVADSGQYNSITVNANTRFLTVNALANLKDLTLYNGPMTVNAGEGAIHGNLVVRDAAGLSLTQNANNIMAEGSGSITVDHANINLNSTTQTLRSRNDLYLAGGAITGNANGVGLNFVGSSSIYYTGNSTISANMTVATGSALTVQAGKQMEDTLTLSGSISGAGNITMQGDGRVLLSGANTAYTGAVTVQQQTGLKLGHVDALAGATLNLAADGTLLVDRAAVGAPFNIGKLNTIANAPVTLAEGTTLTAGTIQIHSLQAMDATSAADAAFNVGTLLVSADQVLNLTLSFAEGESLQTMKTYNLFTSAESLADVFADLNVELYIAANNISNHVASSQYKLVYDATANVIAIRTMLGNIWDGGADGDGTWSRTNTDKNWTGKDYDESSAYNDAIFADLTGEGAQNAVVTIQGTVNPGDVYFESGTTVYELKATEDGAMLTAGNVIHKAGKADVTLNLANNGTAANALGGMELQAGATKLAADLAVAGEVSVAAGATLQTGGNQLLMVGGDTVAYTTQGTYSGLTMDATGIAGVSGTPGTVTNGIINGAAELSNLNLTGTGKLTDVTIGSGVTVATDATYTLRGLVAFNDTLLNNGTVNFAEGVTVELGGLSSTLSQDGTSYIYQLVQGDGTIKGLASGITEQDSGITASDVFINGVNLSAGLADGIATVLSSDKGTVSISIGAITSGENETLTVDGSIAVTSWDARWGETSGQPSLAKRYTGDYNGAYYFAEGADSEYAYNKVVNAANADKVNGGNAIVVYLSAEAFGDVGSELAAPVHGEAFAGHETWVYDSSDVYQVVAGQHFSSAQTGFTQNEDTHLYVDANNTQAKAWVVGGSWNVAQRADSYVTVENGTINSLVGAGVFAAAQFGTAHVYVDGGTVSNIYGAGFENGAHLTADTDKNANAVEMLLTGGTITNVYGGAGANSAAATPSVTGNIAVTVEGNATITTLFGGSKNGGAVTGNINLDLNSGSITTVHAAGASGSTLTGNVTVTLHNDDVVSSALYGGKQTTNKVNGNYTSTLYLAEAGEYVFAKWQGDAAGTHDGYNRTLVEGSAVTVAGFDVISLAQGAVLTVDTRRFDRDITDGTLVITGNGIVQMGGEGDARRAIRLENGATFKLLSSYTAKNYSSYSEMYAGYSKLYVTDGTTFDISGHPREINEADGGGSIAYHVYLSGDGVDGMGALYKGATDKNASTSPSGKAALGYIELTGNASATAEHNIAMIGPSNRMSYFDLNGYTFTKRGEGAYVMRNTQINGGTLYAHVGSYIAEGITSGQDTDMVLTSDTTFTLATSKYTYGEGDDAKTEDKCDITIRTLSGNGATDLGAFKLTLAPVSGGKYYAEFMDEANSYDNLMSGTGFAYGVYSGKITGAGSLYIGNKTDTALGARTGVQYLSGTDSTYSGGTHVEAGRLYLLSSTQGSISKGGSEVTSGPIGTGALYWDSTKAEVYLGHGVTVYNAGGTNAAGSDLILGVEGAPDGDRLSNYPGVNGTVVKDGVTYHEVDTHNLQSISCDGVYADGTAYVAGTEIDRNKMLLVTEAAWNSESSTVKGFTDTGYNEATYSGVLSGAAALVKVGAGTLVIDQANAYTGGTRIQAGTLKLKGWAQIGAAADGTIDVTQTAGSTLMLAYDGTYGDELSSISNNMVLKGTGDARWEGSEETGGGTAALISDVGSGVTFTLSGNISGEGNLLHSGEGTLVLSGDSSFTGGTHATRGVVEVQSATGLGAGVVNIESTADLHVTVEEGTTASRVATTLATAGTTVQGDVVISGTESTERILNVATDGYNNSSTTLHDNGTLLVNGAGVNAKTALLTGSGTVAVSDATGSGASATVGQMTAYTGDFVVEGNKASITVENGSYSGGSISVSGNDAVLSTKGDITITNGESLSLSSRGNAGTEKDAAYVTTTGSVSVASGATLSVSDAATSYEYNLQNLQAAASLNGDVLLAIGKASTLNAFGANVEGVKVRDDFYFNSPSSDVMNSKAAGAVDAKGGLTMASGATYETAMANTSLMGGSLTLESGLTLSTTLDLGAAAIDGSGRTTQLVLFSDVNSVNFVLDNINAVAKSGIYYTKAENYITGNYIDEDTWLVYDSGAGVVYLDGIVPEPTTATLSLLALAALAARRRRR